MGGGSSKDEQQQQHSVQHMSSSISQSQMGPDGKVKIFQDTFTGSGKDGVFEGKGYTFHNIYPPLVAAIVLAMVILTVFMIKIQIRNKKKNHNDELKKKIIVRVTENPLETEMQILGGSETA